MTLTNYCFRPVIGLAALLISLQGSTPAWGAAWTGVTPTNEIELIKILQSDAPASEKAITCKKLAVYGGKQAVPALAPLLANEELASWARIALEAIPDPSVDEALRAALPKVDGRLLIGLINSIGFRRDAQAVSSLTAKLADQNDGVGMAAAEALGRIGGDASAGALGTALSQGRPEIRSSVAYGLILCAEQLLNAGNGASAVVLYEKVRSASVPKQRVLEATRGTILARGSGGIPLLLEQLRSADIALVGIGLRTARELPGRDVTEAIANELDKAAAERQVPLLLALSDRTDSSVLPKLLHLAESGSKTSRAAALGLLDRYRDLSCVPVLLAAAAESDAQLSVPARTSLARLGGKEVDADLLARLRLATGKNRQVLIDLAKQRRIADALPVILKSVSDSEASTRRAAVEAIGILGNDAQAADLVRLFSAAASTDEREDIETALTSICGRSGARALPAVLPLVQSTDSALRIVGLHALASAGGAPALAAVKNALQDREEAVQDEAVRTLSNWPNTWPDDSEAAEPLLSLAKSGKKGAHRLQGLQGYLQYVQETKKLTSDEKLEKVNALLPMIQTAEEKRLVIAVLGSLPNSGALDRLMAYTQDSAVLEEACQAVLRITSDKAAQQISADARRKALQTVAEKTEADATKKRAADALKRIR